MSPDFTRVLVLINALSIGRYFTYDFVLTFLESIMKEMGISEEKVLQLLEWYQWPNMILSVICGFLMDNLLGMKASLLVFSSIALLGHCLFIVSFYTKIFWLCCASQVLFGVGYETLFIIQLSFYGRHFMYGKIYSVVGILFGISLGAIFVGKLILPLIFKGLHNDLKHTTLALILPHLFSFSAAFCLVFFTDLEDNRQRESYVLKKYFHMNFFVIVSVFIFYYSPNLQFWADFKGSLYYKYDKSGYIPELFFAVTSVFMVICGFLLDYFKTTLVYLLGGLITIVAAHFWLTFTFVTPWPFVVVIGIGHAVSQLIIWVYLFSMVPKNEYATAMGFLQSFQNLTFAMSNHLKPMIMNSCGVFIQGIINILCIMTAYVGALFLWYLY